jgi:hypothetical protein
MRQARRQASNRDPVDDAYWTPQPTGTYVSTDDDTNMMTVFHWPWDRH